MSVKEITSHIASTLDGDYSDGLDVFLSALRVDDDSLSLIVKYPDTGEKEQYIIRVTRML